MKLWIFVGLMLGAGSAHASGISIAYSIANNGSPVPMSWQSLVIMAIVLVVVGAFMLKRHLSSLASFLLMAGVCTMATVYFMPDASAVNTSLPLSAGNPAVYTLPANPGNWPASITVTNDTGQPATLNGVFFVDDSNVYYAVTPSNGGNCTVGQVLAAGASCTVLIAA
jgi:hypothetical protein